MTKITISQEGSNPISITLPNNKSTEGFVFKPVKNIKEYINSDKFVNNVKLIGSKIEGKGLTILNEQTIKPLRRSFSQLLQNLWSGNNKIKESDFYNSVKWIKIDKYTVSVVTHVTGTGLAGSEITYKNFYIWYTKDNNTCKAKEVGCCSIRGEHW